MSELYQIKDLRTKKNQIMSKVYLIKHLEQKNIKSSDFNNQHTKITSQILLNLNLKTYIIYKS